MQPADMITVSLACRACGELLVPPLHLTDVWGIKVPEGTTDEYAWLRTISGEPWFARREGSSRGTPFGLRHGPRTDRYGPVFWEYGGHVTLRFCCKTCGAAPERRLDRLLTTVAEDAERAPQQELLRYSI